MARENLIRGFAANQLIPKLPQKFTLLKELLIELIDTKLIRLDGATISLVERTAVLSEKAQSTFNAIRPILERDKLQPPVLHELAKSVGIPVETLEPLIKECVASGCLVRPTANRVFLPEAMNQVQRLITQLDQRMVSPCNRSEIPLELGAIGDRATRVFRQKGGDKKGRKCTISDCEEDSK